MRLCCGVMGLAVSVIARHGLWPILIAITIRFSPLIIFMAFGYNDQNFWEWWLSPPFALVDGGTAPGIQSILPLTPQWVQFDPVRGFLYIALALMITLLMALTVTCD